MTKKLPRREPRKWLLWCTISDTPFEGEEYLTEQQLRDSLLLETVAGVKTGKLVFQLLPQRKKGAKVGLKAQKDLDNPLPTAGK